MIRCRRYRRQLPLWIGGDLEERLALRVRLHVRNCPACAAAAEALRRAHGAVEQAASEPVPVEGDSLWPQIRPLCRAESPRRSDVRGWLPAVSLAAACVAVVAAVAVLPSVPPPVVVDAPGPSAQAGVSGSFGFDSTDRPILRAEEGARVDTERRLVLPEANLVSTRGSF
jgi:anti-sigma factor RsiW